MSGSERTAGLPAREVETGHVDLRVQPRCDLGRVGRLQEQAHRFGEVAAGIFDRIALAGDVQLGTERDVAISLASDDRGSSIGRPAE
jgi:hypothetical protein